jgi:hypothetical protein
MKNTEIYEKVERHLSTDEKQSNKPLNPGSKGTVNIEGEYAALKFERRLFYPKDVVWKAITDPR